MTATSPTYSPGESKEMSHALGPSSQEQQKTGPETGDNVTYNMGPGSKSVGTQEAGLGTAQFTLQIMLSNSGVS